MTMLNNRRYMRPQPLPPREATNSHHRERGRLRLPLKDNRQGQSRVGVQARVRSEVMIPNHVVDKSLESDICNVLIPHSLRPGFK